MSELPNTLRGICATFVAGLIAAMVPLPVSAAACASAAYHQFDFFVGRWKVFNRDGRLVGTDVVRKELGGCAISERFTDTGGGVGIGLSGYQSATKTWYQDFMDDGGLVVTLRGRPSTSAAMVLDGDDYVRGKHRLDRGVWTVRGNEIEELWTASMDGGKTWTTVFDGFFRRQ